MTDPVVMGIDYGTESVRVGIFTLDGRPLIFTSAAYPLRHPRPGWAEQRADEWWDALVIAVRRAMSRERRGPGVHHRHRHGRHLLHGDGL